MNQLKPKIYVICVAAYQQGRLHGEWIDANQFVHIIEANIKEMLSKSPILDAEEWLIYAQGDFGGIRIDACEDLGRVVMLAKFVAKYGELGTALLDRFAGDLQRAKNVMEQAYLGAHADQEDFAWKYFTRILNLASISVLRQEGYEASSVLSLSKKYIDYKNYAKDLLSSDFFSLDVGGKIHVFKNTST